MSARMQTTSRFCCVYTHVQRRVPRAVSCRADSAAAGSAAGQGKRKGGKDPVAAALKDAEKTAKQAESALDRVAKLPSARHKNEVGQTCRPMWLLYSAHFHSHEQLLASNV